MAGQAANTAPAPVGMGSIVANWRPPPFEAPGGSATPTRRATSDAPPMRRPTTSARRVAPAGRGQQAPRPLGERPSGTA